MVNKKGYLRTVEAIIALVLILIVVVVVMPKKQAEDSSVPYYIQEIQDNVKSRIMLDENLKNKIASGQSGSALKDVGDIIEEVKKPGLSYAYKICDNPVCVCGDDDTSCQKPTEEGPSSALNVYVGDVFVSSTATGSHKIVRFWIWEE